MRSTVRWTAPVALGLGLSCAPIAQPNSRTGPEPGVPIRDRYAAARLDLLEAINADRAAAARPPVALDSLATLAAQTHARAMADGGFFSHYGQAGEAPYERLAEAGGTATSRRTCSAGNSGPRTLPSTSTRGKPSTSGRLRHGSWARRATGPRSSIIVAPGSDWVSRSIARAARSTSCRISRSVPWPWRPRLSRGVDRRRRSPVACSPPVCGRCWSFCGASATHGRGKAGIDRRRGARTPTGRASL
ncbi:MAG: hypothetical protein H0W36_01155 [Gemmatimonadetes bacterium]|nr:hypothetical protein [Gemmatimonadota bacterium]